MHEPSSTPGGGPSHTLSGTTALEYFLKAYLNQDWPLDAATVWDVVREFRRAERPDRLQQLGDDIDAVLAQDLDEAALRELLVATLGGWYEASGDHMTYRTWLTGTRRIAAGDERRWPPAV